MYPLTHTFPHFFLYVQEKLGSSGDVIAWIQLHNISLHSPTQSAWWLLWPCGELRGRVGRDTQNLIGLKLHLITDQAFLAWINKTWEGLGVRLHLMWIQLRTTQHLHSHHLLLDFCPEREGLALSAYILKIEFNGKNHGWAGKFFLS